MHLKKTLIFTMFVFMVLGLLFCISACESNKVGNDSFVALDGNGEENIEKVDMIDCNTENGRLKYVRFEKASSELTDKENAYVFVFEFTNKQSNPKQVQDVFKIRFFQNGVEIENLGSWTHKNGDEQGDLINAYFNEVLKDGILSFALATLPKDTSPITITVKGDDVYQMMEVSLDGFSNSETSSASGEKIPVYAKTKETIYGQTYVYSDYTIDEKGRITGYKRDDEQYTLTYDEKGNLLTEKHELSNGKSYTDTYTYDENNMLIRHDDSSRNNTYVFTYEYDNQGRVIKKHSELKDGDYPQDWLYEYDESDVLIKETQVSKHSTYEISYAYDENGNVKSETVVDKKDGSTDYQPVTYEIVGYYSPAK